MVLKGAIKALRVDTNIENMSFRKRDRFMEPAGGD